MENFNLYNPTKLHFGKNVLNDLHKTVSLYGKKVLLVYGKKSIKENGLYEKIIQNLKQIDAEIFEFCGIKSNPIVEDVDEAAKIGRQNNVDVIIAVGGGSVIDSAKIISIAIPVNHTAWNFYNNKAKPAKAIPLIAVLTLAATGTEMNPFAVLQNNSTLEKNGYGHYLLYPKNSFLDPQNTFTVPKNYTSYGIVDLIAHCLEAYFAKGNASLSDRFVSSIIKEAIEYGPKLLKDLHNYELRANIMYASTCALNGLTSYGRESTGDWGVHSLGHILSLLYDIPHGASLSIAYPAWLKLQKNRIPERIVKLGNELFNSKTCDETIAEFEKFFISIESPVRLSEVDIINDQKNKILDVMTNNKAGGNNHKLNVNDYTLLIDLMM